MKAKHRRTLCPCMHGLEHHPERGPCTYGAGSVFGGCRCPGFGTPKSRQPSGPVDPDELAIDAAVRDANAALSKLASTMKDILRRRREALASGDVDGRVVLQSDRRHGKGARTIELLRGQPPDSFEIVAKAPRTIADDTKARGLVHQVSIDRGPTSVDVEAAKRLGELTTIARVLLTVCAQRLGPLNRKQILLFADRRQSGDTSTAFAFLLRDRYLVEAGGAGGLCITTEGKRVLGPVDPLPTGPELRQHLLATADPFTSCVLAELFEVYPNPLTRGELLERTGYRQSGDTSTAFAKMLTCGHAIKVGKSGLAAAPELFA